MSDEIPVGFLDPVSSRNSKWTAVSAAVMGENNGMGRIV